VAGIMTALYSHWLVGLSVVVAVLVSYTALRLAARVAASEGYAARIWPFSHQDLP
jgi:NO-binding membrane sensor protein with MHYT domain